MYTVTTFEDNHTSEFDGIIGAVTCLLGRRLYMPKETHTLIDPDGYIVSTKDIARFARRIRERAVETIQSTLAY